MLRTCKATVWLIKENSESLTSFSKITSGAIITDLWVERVKHVKHGPRNDRKVWLRKMPIGRIFGAQTTCTSARTTVETGVCSLDFVFCRNDSEGKASLKRQKSPETTTDTQDVSKFY